MYGKNINLMHIPVNLIPNKDIRYPYPFSFSSPIPFGLNSSPLEGVEIALNNKVCKGRSLSKKF